MIHSVSAAQKAATDPTEGSSRSLDCVQLVQKKAYPKTSFAVWGISYSNTPSLRKDVNVTLRLFRLLCLLVLSLVSRSHHGGNIFGSVGGRLALDGEFMVG